ncbi:MAG: hypothetical protein RMM08_06975 [Armatimonadota bacterium]|nr:hypothetical protein [bacterium]MDW8321087.1 hypothetical protein [Armatimonadota bacterium]
MSSEGLTEGKRLAILSLALFIAAGWLSGCARSPSQKMVTVQWRALLVYHPLWEMQVTAHALQPPHIDAGDSLPAMLVLPGMTLQPMQTPEAEQRRQRIAQTSARQQQELSARLQQIEARLLQAELSQLDTEQETEVERARQEALRQAEREVEEALRQHRQPQADAEIKRRVLQRLIRIRPDQRDTLNARLQEVEAEQQHLSETLRRRLASIEEETAYRLQQLAQDIEQDYNRKRAELRERSAKRLLAEQLRASVQIRAFVNIGKPITFSQTIVKVPDRAARTAYLPVANAVPQQDIRPLIEQDVKRWVEAICRRHRWVPIWQVRAGAPDVTTQIAQEMRGTAP